MHNLHKPMSQIEDVNMDAPDDNSTQTTNLRCSNRNMRPSTRICESLKYLKGASAHTIDAEVWIPKSFQEAISRLDLWWELMVKELGMLRE